MKISHVEPIDPPGTDFWIQLLEELRKKSGLSVNRLSLESGMNRSTLVRILSGDGSRLSVSNLETLLGVLGHELDAHEVKSLDEVKAELALTHYARP